MDKYNTDPHPFETVPEGEAAQIREIADLMVKLLDQRYRDKPQTLRGVHPKSHGCAHASFQIECDIPDDYRMGLFALPGAAYAADIRFSNAAALVGPDVDDSEGREKRKHGSRGMAIKVRGVSAPVIDEKDEPGTQDFLMVNLPVFPFANVADYLELTKAQLAAKDDARVFLPAFGGALSKLPGGPARLGAVLKISGAISATAMTSPLESSYFSAAPFLFGPKRVMKFSAVPVSPAMTSNDEPLAGDYLRSILAKQLSKEAYHFDFMVQVQEPKDELKIEDVTVLWDPAKYSFRKVARLTIPQQDITGDAALAACERLFFTPWHSLKDHRPLGGINRLRREVYLASARHRLGKRE
jgi:catalase